MGPFLQDDGSFYAGNYKEDNDKFKKSSQKAIREKAIFVDEFYKDFKSNDKLSFGKQYFLQRTLQIAFRLLRSAL